MNKNSRTENSIINFIVNSIYQFFLILLTFATRRVFVGTLNINYLGISGLFSSIITVLSLSELGVGAAIYYSMYKEIANNNKEKLKALISYYRHLYNRIALAILIIGLLILPFLNLIVNTETEIPNLKIYYLITLLGTVTSYLFVYKTSIVSADQKEYKLKIISIVIRTSCTIIQIISLKMYKNYLLFIVIELVFGILGNIISAYLAEKWYPFIKEKAELSQKDKKDISLNIKSMFVYKVSCALLNNTDNIIISVIVGTKFVGYNSNYLMLSSKLLIVISLFFNSIRASVGNFNVEAPVKEQFHLFKILNFSAYWLYSFATIGVFCCGEDFIRAITASGEYVLGFPILLATALNLYISVFKGAVAMYRETTGLFRLSKYVMLASSILNVILSVILGKIFGLFGVLIATFISRLLCDAWYEPFILYKKIFKESVRSFYVEQVGYLLFSVLMTLVLYPLNMMISIDNLYLRIVVKFILCSLFVNVVYIIVYRKKEEFVYLKNKLLEVFNILYKQTNFFRQKANK